MLPPEADPSVDTYKAKYDLFIWSWYETVEPNVLLQIFLCDQIGSSSDSLWCNKDFDKLYDDQNHAANDQERKRIIDEMQNLFYDEAPYHILYYDQQLDAYRTDKFAGWQNQPVDGGYPLFSYSAIDYQFLTDAKAAPSAAPSNAAPGGGSAAPAASGSGTPTPTSTGSDNTPLILAVVVAAAVVVLGGVLVARRRSAAGEEE
jgi:peptide/nickel transport system substrate-binding protein